MQEELKVQTVVLYKKLYNKARQTEANITIHLSVGRKSLRFEFAI